MVIPYLGQSLDNLEGLYLATSFHTPFQGVQVERFWPSMQTRRSNQRAEPGPGFPFLV